MLSLSSPVRKAFHAALCALVVAALARCLLEDSREVGQLVSAATAFRLALPMPIQAPAHDCDREHGCICRGATSVAAIDLTPHQPLITGRMPLDDSLAGSQLLVDGALGAGPSAADDFLPPPISGRQLRALYASLVI